MKLHELERGRIYIGDDGIEYLPDWEYLIDLSTDEYVSLLDTLTQDFTEKSMEEVWNENK